MPIPNNFDLDRTWATLQQWLEAECATAKALITKRDTARDEWLRLEEHYAASRVRTLLPLDDSPTDDRLMATKNYAQSREWLKEIEATIETAATAV